MDRKVLGGVSCLERHSTIKQSTYFPKETLVAEWVRTLIFSTLHHLSSHRCGFEPSLDHMRSQVLLVGGQVVFLGALLFSPNLTIDLAQNEWNNLDPKYPPSPPPQKTEFPIAARQHIEREVKTTHTHTNFHFQEISCPKFLCHNQ